MNQMYQYYGNSININQYAEKKNNNNHRNSNNITNKKNVEVDMEGVETERIILAGEVAASMKYKWSYIPFQMIDFYAAMGIIVPRIYKRYMLLN